MSQQAAWIKDLRPAFNKDDGLADDFVFEQKEEGHAFEGLINPSSPPAKKKAPRAKQPAAALVALGKLTALTYRDPDSRRERTMRWRLYSAPLLAYVPEAKAASLRVVYGARVVGAASAAQVKEYARTHWGNEGEGEIVSGRILSGDGKKLGALVSVTYTTTKGDRVLTDFEHLACDGSARRRCIPPGVLFGAGMVSLAGGTYHVDSRGIVG